MEEKGKYAVEMAQEEDAPEEEGRQDEEVMRALPLRGFLKRGHGVTR